MKQGKIYIEQEADKWFIRNEGLVHNCFTEYLLNLFPKKDIYKFDVAEFGIGRGNNISLLSHFVNSIDGYDGSKQAIENLNRLSKINYKINGKRVNFGEPFSVLKKYNIVIFGFFMYMLSNEEIEVLLNNTLHALKNDNAYIYMYDFISNKPIKKKDIYNDKIYVYKRDLIFYLNKLAEDYILIDFRLWDNRKLEQYLLNDNIMMIDTKIDSDDYNYVFSALFKRKN